MVSRQAFSRNANEDSWWCRTGIYKSAGWLWLCIIGFFQVATDLLVRQKNFSMGQPNHEIQITQLGISSVLVFYNYDSFLRPLPRAAFLEKIHIACGKDYSAISLTQVFHISCLFTGYSSICFLFIYRRF